MSEHAPTPRAKPCPFCGNRFPVVCTLDDVFRHVECDVCGAQGPREGTEDEDEQYGHDYAAAALRDAIIAWNGAPRPRKARA